MPGGKVVLSEGTFSISAQITVESKPVSLVGQGINATTIKLANATNTNMIRGGSTTTAPYFHLAHLTLDGNGANQSSNGNCCQLGDLPDAVFDCVRFTNSLNNGVGGGIATGQITFRDCVWDNNIVRGANISNFGRILVEGGRVEGNTDDGLRFNGPFEKVLVIGTYFKDNLIGLEIGSGQWGAVYNSHFEDNRSMGAHWNDTENCIAVGNTVDGGVINGLDTGTGLRVVIMGNICRNISGGIEQRGIFAGRGAKGGVVIGNVCEGNGHQGIIVTGSNYIVENNICKNNGQSGTQTEGIRVWAVSQSASDITLRGNRCFDDQGIKTQGDGIRLVASDTMTLSDVIVEGNKLDGNATNAYATQALGSGTITVTRIRNNVGYVTENSGTFSIASGATTAVITHGLNITPVAEKISVIFKEQGTNDYGRWWVDTITSTQFTIRVSADPGASNLDGGWSYRH